MKGAEEGKLTGIKGTKTESPENFQLGQNYPNPFNPITKINYRLLSNTNTILKIYNIQGAEIKTLINEHQAPGRYSVTFNATGLQSGVYFCRLETTMGNKTRKILLLK